MLNNEFDNLFSRKFEQLHEQVDPGQTGWDSLSQRLDRRDNRRNLLTTAAMVAGLLLLGANLWVMGNNKEVPQQHKTVFIYDTIIKRSVVYDTTFRKVVVKTPVYSNTNTFDSGLNLSAKNNTNLFNPSGLNQNTLQSFNQDHQNTLKDFNQNTLQYLPVSTGSTESSNVLTANNDWTRKPEDLVGPLAGLDVKNTTLYSSKQWTPTIKPDFLFPVTRKVNNDNSFRLNDFAIGFDYGRGTPLLKDMPYHYVKTQRLTVDAQLWRSFRTRVYLQYINGNIQSTHTDGLGTIPLPPSPHNNSLFKYWELYEFSGLGYGIDLRYQHQTNKAVEPYVGVGLSGTTMLPYQMEFEYNYLDPSDNMVKDYSVYKDFGIRTSLGTLNGFAGLDVRISPHIHIYGEYTFVRRFNLDKAYFFDNMNQYRLGIKYSLKGMY